LFSLRFHPRRRYKPLSCQTGKHHWETVNYRGIPMLVCRKCGAIVSKAIHEKTVGERDYRKLTKLGAYRPLTKEEMMEIAWQLYQKYGSLKTLIKGGKFI